MKRTWMVLAVLIGVLLAGCSGGDEEASGTPDTTPEPAAQKSATPEPDDEPVGETEASVQQYASLIAQNGDLREELDTMAECNWLGDGQLDPDPALVTCGLGLLGLQWTAEAFHTNLLLASVPPKVDTGHYLGKPPAEIEKLLTQTLEAAETLSEKAKEANDAGCAQTGEGECGKLRLAVRSAIGDMQSTLDGWSPYM